MPTPTSHSPGVNTEATATTIADTTTSSIAAGRKVFAAIGWFGNVTVTGVSGGGLTWTVNASSPGAGVIHTAIASADAPAGLASSTVITATFSATCFARAIRISSCDGLALNPGGVDAIASTTLSSGVGSWQQNITTVDTNTLVFGVALIDAYAGAAAATGTGVFELYDWPGTDSNTVYHAVYRNSAVTSSGVGGTFTGTKDKCSAAVAFKLAGAAAIPPMIVLPPRRP